MQLISSPARAWEEIHLEEDRRKVLMDFVYPLLGLCGLAVFLGALFSLGWGEPESYRYAMQECCAVVVSLFGGYFLAAYLMNVAGMRLFRLADDAPLMQQFAGYASVVVFLLNVVLGLFPKFPVVMALLLQFYTVYIVWEGVLKMVQIEEKDRLRFTVLFSVLLLLCPFAIDLLFGGMVKLLN